LAALDPTFVLSNRIEAAFWAVVAIGFAIAALRTRGKPRLDCLTASLTFALFGGSDLVESRTGAWWRPWWLLLWKGACLAILLCLLSCVICGARV
jgi:hypothetical protein